MNEETKEYDCGVIVGRFQVPELHESHKKLFDHVVARHERVICILGNGHLRSTKRNPLDYQQRMKMIQEDYPNIICLYQNDCKSNAHWSGNLDAMISENLSQGLKPLLYGSRDSFIKHYEGRFDTEELESDSFISGTQIRKEVTRTIHASKEFRMGVVVGASNRYPVNFVTVDIAIMDKDETRILLARKPNEDEYRFVGGFSDPDSPRLEDDAIREVMEETHCEIDEPKYITSMRINDWRYRGEADSICTTFFKANYIGGTPQADDDIAEIRWFDIDFFKGVKTETGYEAPHKNLHMLVGEHKNLMEKLLDHLND